MKIKFIIQILVVLSLINLEIISTRSIFRPDDPLTPEITTQWKDGGKKYYLRHTRLSYVPLFKKFDRDFFDSHMLPDGKINFRSDPDKSVNGSELKELFEELLKEIYQQKTEYTNFTVLKRRDFNMSNQSGVIILKCKKYPFVVKIFIETPESFVRPFSKGFEPSVFFIMGGGINRYLSGFTRIKNLEVIKKQIEEDPVWSKKIDVPRKWYWAPKNNKWFTLTGKNIGQQKTTSIELPSVYAIVSDAITVDKGFSIFNKQNRKDVIALSKFLGNRIDPHIDNYLREKDTGLLVIVDSEHFPTMVGLKKPLTCDSYAGWYSKLVVKCSKDMFAQDKRARRAAQFNEEPEYLAV